MSHDALLIAQHRRRLATRLLLYQVGFVFVLFSGPKCEVGIFERILRTRGLSHLLFIVLLRCDGRNVGISLIDVRVDELGESAF